MKNILLYAFICFTTVCTAQSFSQTLVSDESYGIHSNIINTNPEVSVFPNPASDFITIGDADDVVRQITFYNVLGKEVASYEAVNGKKIDIMDFQNGIYLVQLKDIQGQIIRTIRVRKI